MKKRLFWLLLLGVTQLSFAARILPVNMDIAVLKQYQQQQIELSPDGFSWLRLFTLGWLDRAKVFDMAAGVRVRDEDNRFVTYDQLGRFRGKVVAVKRDQNNQINEIWILSQQETEQFRRIAKQREANQQ